MNSPETNYPHKGWIAVTALIAVLVAVSFIPPQTIGGIHLRRANILSDIFSFDDANEDSAGSVVLNEAEFHVDMVEVAQQIEADTIPKQIQTTFEWTIPHIETPRAEIASFPELLGKTLVPIEDFSADRAMQGVYDALLDPERTVRIAFLGDSFIEGDILTADLRERLQLTYGGHGTGFAPMASPLTAFRRSVKTQSKGWTSYGIMQRRNAPAAMRDNFSISGWVCQPAADASTRWEGTSFRQRLDSCTTARVLFISPSDSRVEVTINDSLRREFTVPGDASVRQVVVSAPAIRSLAFRVISGTEGFVGYGAVFEAPGVAVDNYSIRSNNGQAMFWTNPAVNAQINTLLGYDLVILQYGLNIMQAGVRNYTNYSAQMEKMVTYIRQCFPGAAVLVMGVSDRMVKTASGLAPMDAIPSMLECQRKAAENTGAAFWSTCVAMRAEGGMEQFVARGWAGKDFTHINYAGGRRIAWSLFDAFNAGVAEAYERQQAAIREEIGKPILDTTQRHRIERQLLPGVLSDTINSQLQ